MLEMVIALKILNETTLVSEEENLVQQAELESTGRRKVQSRDGAKSGWLSSESLSKLGLTALIECCLPCSYSTARNQGRSPIFSLSPNIRMSQDH